MTSDDNDWTYESETDSDAKVSDLEADDKEDQDYSCDIQEHKPTVGRLSCAILSNSCHSFFLKFCNVHDQIRQSRQTQ